MAFSDQVPILVTLVLGYLCLFVRAWKLRDNFNVASYGSTMWFETSASNSEYVSYLSREAAESSGLLANQNGRLYLGVDSNSSLNPDIAGRRSVRLRSNNKYNATTLVIGDFVHMPANVCGVWPSFWLVGPVWPRDGEIDILEGVNQMPQNQITIHSKTGCRPGVGAGGETGARTGLPDCGDNNGDIGCGVFNTRVEGWGNGLNIAGGAVYAMLWTTDAIKVWSWKQNQVPGDIRQDKPNPSAWGTPVANWVGCNFGTYFHDMNLIINTAFCGNWAGAKAVWNQGSCGPLAATCNQYVAWNPQVYKEAYWLINSIKVYVP